MKRKLLTAAFILVCGTLGGYIAYVLSSWALGLPL